MRQIISTAVVAVIVGALAGATMSAVAQAPAEQSITPAAGINADKVDGKHAIGYTTRKLARRGKLVATNRRGELPSNIVSPLWRLMRGVPATLADGQIDWGEIQNKPGFLDDREVGWAEVKNKPAGFEDGKDNIGFVSKVIWDSTSSALLDPINPGQTFYMALDGAASAIITAEPLDQNGELQISNLRTRLFDGSLGTVFELTNLSASKTDFKVRIVDFGAGPNGITTAQSKTKYNVRIIKKRNNTRRK